MRAIVLRAVLVGLTVVVTCCALQVTEESKALCREWVDALKAHQLGCGRDPVAYAEVYAYDVQHCDRAVVTDTAGAERCIAELKAMMCEPCTSDAVLSCSDTQVTCLPMKYLR
jgi:hypothetical protein